MIRRISDKSKQILHMGEGKGKDYVPYILTSEFNSLGTTSIITDWKTGRNIHCMSQGEAMWYFLLRWDDSNIDIREQFPLDNKITVKIADELGIKHPQDRNHIMTTDFLVTKSDNSLHAYSVKVDKNLNDRTVELLYIEREYWKYNGVPFDMLYSTDVNQVLVNNIRLITEFYNKNAIYDKYSYIKHLIAIKEIDLDISKTVIDNNQIDKKLEEIHYE